MVLIGLLGFVEERRFAAESLGPLPGPLPAGEGGRIKEAPLCGGLEIGPSPDPLCGSTSPSRGEVGSDCTHGRDARATFDWILGFGGPHPRRGVVAD